MPHQPHHAVPSTGLHPALTIGQAAAYADITIKTVRHYHRLGLIAEPSRDRSGYRRYTATDLSRLVQIRTLAAAGVPLAEIPAILEASPERFADTLADIGRRLDEHIAELTARRETLRRLAEGDRILLPPKATALLERARALGFADEDTALVGESLVLMKAIAPEDFDAHVAHAELVFADPDHMALLVRCGTVADLDPDDPRVDELADDMAAYLTAHPELVPTLPGLDDRSDGATRFELLYRYGEDRRRALARLNTLIAEKLAQGAGGPDPRRP
ncbi:MAG TPA: MerR family transcriptional regulator [Phytomonospora sp.]